MHDPKNFVLACQAALDAGLRTPDGKKLEVSHIEIARTLAFWRSDTPTHGDLAKHTRRGVATVKRALAVFCGLGLVSWERRTVGLCGWRAKVANRYTLAIPAHIGELIKSRVRSLTMSYPGPAPRPADDKLRCLRILAARVEKAAKATLDAALFATTPLGRLGVALAGAPGWPGAESRERPQAAVAASTAAPQRHSLDEIRVARARQLGVA